jgi:nitrite reductase/ring-hydroxylating ferredoxin subunit
MADFQEVARLDEIPEDQGKQVTVKGELIGLFRAGDEVFAISDICTHEEAYLHEGEFEPEEYEVECPLHGSRFDVRDGAVRILPATKPVTTYEVRVEGDLISVGPPRERKE